MSCEKEIYMSLIDKVLDHEASEEEQYELRQHMSHCDFCREHFTAMTELLDELKEARHVTAPEGFTESVMSRLPLSATKIKRRRWFQKHPVLTAASLFFVLMSASVLATWNEGNELSVETNSKHVKVIPSSHLVVVPKGETVKGDLIVENGDVRIEGKVEGDVVVIKGERYMASAGEVTGDSKEIHQVVDWAWYKLKHLFISEDQ